MRGVLEVDLGDVASRIRASPGLVAADENSWAVRMQAMRKRFGKDSKRIYGHFVVLPDPDDKVSAEERAHVADEWAGAMLPGFEHAVVIHDDNKTGITYDRVVVNTVHPKTGYKIQVSDSDIYRQWDKLQRTCEDHGLVFHRPGGRRARHEGVRSEARRRVHRGRAPGAPGRRLRRDVARGGPPPTPASRPRRAPCASATTSTPPARPGRPSTARWGTERSSDAPSTRAEAELRAGSAHIAHTELDPATDEERIGRTIPDRKNEGGRSLERKDLRWRTRSIPSALARSSSAGCRSLPDIGAMRDPGRAAPRLLCHAREERRQASPGPGHGRCGEGARTGAQALRRREDKASLVRRSITLSRRRIARTMKEKGLTSAYARARLVVRIMLLLWHYGS